MIRRVVREPEHLSWVVAAAALVLRLAVCVTLSNFDDVRGYEAEVVARNLVAGQGMTYHSVFGEERSSYFYPFYSALLAVGYSIMERPYVAVELLQALLGAVVVLLMFRLGRELANPRVGLVAAALYAFNPIHVYWCCRIQPLIIDSLFLVLVTWWVLVLAERPSWSRTAGAGVVAGLAVFSKTLYAIFVPVWALALVIYDRRALRGRLLAAGLFCGAATAVLAPWMVRNTVVQGRFVGLMLGGRSLWYGNNPNASGTIFAEDGRGQLATLDSEQIAMLRELDEVERDRWFRQQAMDYIVADPVRFFAMIPARLAALWYFTDLVPSRFGRAREWVYLAWIVPALAGVYLSLRAWRRWLLIYAMPLITTATYAVYYGEPRFRYVLEPILMLFAALAVDHGLRWIAERRARAAA